jgi:futalosine hydrolase
VVIYKDMSFKILYVAATAREADVLKKLKGIISLQDEIHFRNFEISVLVTGVGTIATAWSLKQWISLNYKPDLAINGGIAGSYNEDLDIGDVVMPKTDCFADAGIEDGDNFFTLHEAGLTDKDEIPYRGGLIFSDTTYSGLMKNILRPVKAITVNTATGSESTREKLFRKFNPDIETMEGASFFYICIREEIPFLALRAISNKVGPRNRSKWDITLALDNLSEKLNEVLVMLE